ncbi:hypothetical protein RCL1_000574 [Eukaryota sp. TZLM3-RCL]
MICSICDRHVFKSPRHVVRNVVCSYCLMSHSEALIARFSEVNFTFLLNYKDFWPKNLLTGKAFDFDIVVGKIIIEVDGIHHWCLKHPSHRKNTEAELLYSIKKDVYKMHLAVTEGFSVIRLPTSCLFDNFWKDELLVALSTLQNLDSPKIVYCETAF